MLGKKYSLGATFENTGEQRVKLANFEELKTQGEDVASFISSFTPDTAFMYLHVIAMGAGEYYGCNINGDYFPEADLIARHKTFETNAKVFKEHDNKPTSPSYGTVVFSWYNPKMHRVELVLAIDKIKGKEFVDRQERGEQMEVSMGTKVAYDVCSICGNKAKKASDYCDHIRYHKKEVYPDGKQAYMINPNPNFFDISIVKHRADRIAYVLDKVASVESDYSLGIYAENFFDTLGDSIPIAPKYTTYDIEDDFTKEASSMPIKKVASTDKLAMIKRIKAQSVRTINDSVAKIVPKLEEIEPDLPDELLGRLARNYSFEDILKSLFTRAIPLKPREATKIIIIQQKLPSDMLPVVERILMTSKPAPISGSYRREIGALIDPFIMSRSSFLPAILSRIEKIENIEKTAATIYTDRNQAFYNATHSTNMGMVVYPDPEQAPITNNNLVVYGPGGSKLSGNYFIPVGTTVNIPQDPLGKILTYLGAIYSGYKYVDPVTVAAQDLRNRDALHNSNPSTIVKKASVIPFVTTHFCSAHYGNYEKVASECAKKCCDVISDDAPIVTSYALNKIAGIIDPEILKYPDNIDKIAAAQDHLLNFGAGVIMRLPGQGIFESGVRNVVEAPVYEHTLGGITSLLDSHVTPVAIRISRKLT